jgi:hypothetical protein
MHAIQYHHATLKVSRGAPHGLAETHRDQVKEDLIEFCAA